MKPRIIQIVVLLLLGAIANIAVAWGAVIWVPLNWDSATYYTMKHETWETYRGHSSCADCYIFFRVTHPPSPEDSSQAVESIPGFPRWAGLTQLSHTRSPQSIIRGDGRGWPFLSLYVRYWQGFPWDPIPDYGWILSGSPSRTRPIFSNTKALPYLPIWPGFAINTIFYAAILWALFFIPGKVRRAIRRRRGLCPACAYPIGKSPVCTECGESVQPRVHEELKQR